jgi:hypothetical protein
MTARLRAVGELAPAPETASATAASTVAFQVRKSLAENAPPVAAVERRAVAEVALEPATQRRERLREAHHVVELLAVAPRPPGVVVAILLAAGRVAARRLQVSVRIRADPDVLPRGRDRELGDPPQDLRIVDAIALLVDVAEPAPAAPAADPGAGAVGAAQANGHGWRSSRRGGL